MPTREIGFDLDVQPADARRAAISALAELGWELREHDDALEAAEDPARLCCTAPQVRAKLRFLSERMGTSVMVQLSVPGFGPIPKRQLADRATGLRQRITRWAAGPAR